MRSLYASQVPFGVKGGARPTVFFVIPSPFDYAQDRLRRGICPRPRGHQRRASACRVGSQPTREARSASNQQLTTDYRPPILPHTETQSHREPQTQPRQDYLARRRWDAEAIINRKSSIQRGSAPDPGIFRLLANSMTNVGAPPRGRPSDTASALPERASRHDCRQSCLQTKVKCVGLTPFLTFLTLPRFFHLQKVTSVGVSPDLHGKRKGGSTKPKERRGFLQARTFSVGEECFLV